MKPDEWQQLKRVLSAAIEQERTTDRADLVRRSCEHDTTLLSEANELLAEAEKLLHDDEDTLEAGVLVAKTTLRGSGVLQKGQRIGAYRIESELGRGGMGAVYLAERADGHFAKQVAIKILRLGGNTEELLQRFRTEQAILARLEHPNIARLLDAGTTEEGLPYFVMEYVDGIPVTHYVRKHSLGVPERLNLFLKICAAVEGAHKNHFLHRDLKAGNILVGEEGEPKLLDFGIAKLLSSDADVTATANRHFTPTCASPEQARGEAVTAASDIYALGALLFEILAGRAPHQFSSRHPSREEITRVVCEDEPPFASVAAIDGDTSMQLRGSLDHIVQRATQKDPDRRYPSVAAFAADLRRHLQGQDVRPLPVHKTYSRSRHWVWFAAAIPVLLAAILVWQPLAGRRAPKLPPVFAKSIAVLPFSNLSVTPEGSFFASGVQDAVLSHLAKIGDLRVINPTSVRRYASDGPRDLREISEQLAVAYVLEGSVQRDANRVRVTAKLTDIRTGAQAWAEHYDRELSDIFAIQSEIAQQIALELRATISPTEKSAFGFVATNNLNAYDRYLRARYLDREVIRTADKIGQQVKLLDEAISEDPSFVSAFCFLARVHLLAYFADVDHSPARLDLAKKALTTAARLAPEAGEVKLGEGILFYWGGRNYPAALKKLEEAHRRLPNDADVLYFSGLVERRLGRSDDAIRHFSEAAALDPLNVNMSFMLGLVHRGLRDYQAAGEIMDHALVWSPDDFEMKQARAMLDVEGHADITRLEKLASSDWARSVNPETLASLRIELASRKRDYDALEQLIETYPTTNLISWEKVMQHEVARAFIARARGRAPEAEAAFRRAREACLRLIEAKPDEAHPAMLLAAVDADLGRGIEACKEGEQALQRSSIAADPTETPEMISTLAYVYARAGETSRALDLLDQSARMPYGVTYGELALDYEWDMLRSEPRFQRIVASLAPTLPTHS